jgi:RNA polymerase sigma factor (sigma-70 family)
MRLEDKESIEGFLQGRSEAVQVIEGWIGQVVRTFWRLAAYCKDAEQESWVRVTRSLRRGNFRGDDDKTLKAYVQQIARHACLDLIEELDLPPRIDDGDDGSGDSPEEKVWTEELLAAIRKALSPECWQMFRMVEAGLSRWEMSRQLGITEQAVRAKLCRCRQRAVEVYVQLTGENP